MDPLTHTLLGASLAATGLGDRTRRAAPALIVGANLPDVDVFSYFAGSDQALAFRRGWTHGFPALVTLPLLLWAALTLWDRWRGSPADPDRPFSPGWLLGLCYLAVWTHPLLDWLNVYGVRWRMPLDGTWYYGDSVFIMDPWLWVILGSAWLVGRPPRRRTLVTLGLLALLLGAVVLSRAPAYLPVIGVAAIALLPAILADPGAPRAARRMAVTGLAVAAVYVVAMVTLHRTTENRVRQQLTAAALGPVEQLMVGPAPVNPLRWDVLAASKGVYRSAVFDWRRGDLQLDSRSFKDARTDPLWQRVEATGEIPGFLGWARFPWLEVEPSVDGLRVHLMDARYARERTEGFGGAVVDLPGAAQR